MSHILHRWQILQGLGALLLAVPATYAQTTTAPPASRTAEVQKLGAFLGEWRLKDGPPDSPNRTICQWAPNGRCLLCDQIHPGPKGSVKELNVFTYDRTQSAYVMKGLRPPRSAPFSIEGQTWTYPGEYAENGKTIRTRVLNTWESPAVMHYVVQASADGGTQWKTNAEGRMMRTTETPAAAGAAPPASPALQALVGTWRLGGQRKAQATCAWSPNGAFLVCDELSSSGDQIVAYSLAEGTATPGSTPIQVQILNPEGGAAMQHLDGTATDTTWTYMTTAAGDNTHGRVRIKRTFRAPDTILGTEEASTDGTKWVVRAEWTETKVTGPATPGR